MILLSFNMCIYVDAKTHLTYRLTCTILVQYCTSSPRRSLAFILRYSILYKMLVGGGSMTTLRREGFLFPCCPQEVIPMYVCCIGTYITYKHQYWLIDKVQRLTSLDKITNLFFLINWTDPMHIANNRLCSHSSVSHN